MTIKIEIFRLTRRWSLLSTISSDDAEEDADSLTSEPMS